LTKEAVDFDVYLTNQEGLYLHGYPTFRWHYGSAYDSYHRIGDILLVSRFPQVFNLGNRKIVPGMHGFDNRIPDMQASFYAWGPAFRRHLKIPSFENINVYPLIARILGLNITTPIDGSEKVLQSTLK
jgi:hypothetical protein